MNELADNLTTRCPAIGALRLALDEREAAPAGVREHIAACAGCADRLADLRAGADAAVAALGRLDAPDSPDATLAYHRFTARLRREALTAPGAGWSRGGLMARFWGTRAARSMTAVAAVFIVMMALTITPARGLADTMLDRFRVQKFAAVTIPMDMVNQFKGAASNMSDADKQAIQQEFQALGTFDTTLNLQSARQVDSVAAASAQYGNLAVPSSLPSGFNAPPRAYVSDAGTASYTLNVGEADALVKRLGLPIYSLPDATTYPTLTFTAEIPKAAVLDYQNADGKHLVVGQMESPTLDIPEGIDMNALREDILQLPGLPTDLVAQLRQIKDWQHTLIIPVPSGATSQDVTMNGQPALLIEGNNGEGSAVLWQKDGFLYIVAGQMDSGAVMDTADSMQ